MDKPEWKWILTVSGIWWIPYLDEYVQQNLAAEERMNNIEELELNGWS